QPLTVRTGSTAQRGDPVGTLYAGDSLWLTGNACGHAPVSLQWVRDGQELPGETNSIFYGGLMTPALTGEYTLRASNSFGAVTSAPVSILVTPLTVFRDLTSQTVYENTYPNMSMTVASFLPVIYQWFKDGALLNSQTNYYLNLAASTNDAGNYQVIGRNAFGSVTSSVAQLTVLLRPPAFTYDLTDTL